MGYEIDSNCTCTCPSSLYVMPMIISSCIWRSILLQTRSHLSCCLFLIICFCVWDSWELQTRITHDLRGRLPSSYRTEIERLWTISPTSVEWASQTYTYNNRLNQYWLWFMSVWSNLINSVARGKRSTCSPQADYNFLRNRSQLVITTHYTHRTVRGRSIDLLSVLPSPHRTQQRINGIFILFSTLNEPIDPPPATTTAHTVPVGVHII